MGNSLKKRTKHTRTDTYTQTHTQTQTQTNTEFLELTRKRAHARKHKYTLIHIHKNTYILYMLYIVYKHTIQCYHLTPTISFYQQIRALPADWCNFLACFAVYLPLPASSFPLNWSPFSSPPKRSLTIFRSFAPFPVAL